MNPYKKLAIYYFSGTGNARNVALWISAIASKHNLVTVIFNIADIDHADLKIPPEDALVIFISPIHGFNYPPVMLEFLLKFPRGKNRVVLMNTRAGMLIGKWITPGLTGIAFYLAALFLKIKGYKISGMVPVDMPSNWISLHPGLNDRTIKYLHEKNKERVSMHAEKIIGGSNDFIALREIIQDVAIAPISVGYYFIGRFFLAKTFYASSECSNCNICIKGCPVKAIIIKDKMPYWTFKCESCMKCMSNCPKKAIETAHGFAIGCVVIKALILTPLIYQVFSHYNITVKSEPLDFIFRYLIFFLFLAIAYRIIHYFLNFRIIQKLMVYTSLTWYKWWGHRYKALEDL